MKKILALLTIVFMVSMVSFQANASPPVDLGINPVYLQIDNTAVADVNIDVAIITGDFIFVADSYGIVKTWQEAEMKSIFIEGTEIGGLLLFSNSALKQRNYLQQNNINSTVLLCYNLSKQNDSNKDIKKKAHIKYKDFKHYTILGYGLWSM